jgi:hypothetical protein
MAQANPQNNLELMRTLDDSRDAQDWETTMSTLRRTLTPACMNPHCRRTESTYVIESFQRNRVSPYHSL